MGMLVILDSFLNRITRNRRLGRNTWIYIDEIYLLFQHEYSANFLFTLWKRVRKYGACCTGLTQNVDDLLQSHTARTMLANSEFLVMLNQASTDRAELARLLNSSDNQLSYKMCIRDREYAEVKEEDEEYISPLDLLFQAIEQDRPDSVAVRRCV